MTAEFWCFVKGFSISLSFWAQTGTDKLNYSCLFFQTLLKPITKHCLLSVLVLFDTRNWRIEKTLVFLVSSREQKSNIQGNSSNMCVIPKTEQGFLYKTQKTRQAALMGSPRYEYTTTAFSFSEEKIYESIKLS